MNESHNPEGGHGIANHIPQSQISMEHTILTLILGKMSK